MKRQTISCLVGLLLIGVLCSASSPAVALDENIFRQRLQEALALTPEQSDSLRFLRADLEAELALLRSDVLTGALLAIEGRIRYREVIDVYRAARQQMLTEDQRNLLQRAQQLARERLLTDGRPPEQTPLEQLPEALDLTTDQVDRWRALLTRQRTEVAESREAGETLQPEDYRRLRESHRIAFESMLSPQQRLTLEQVRHRWRSARELATTMPDSLVIHDELPFPDDFGDYDDDAPIGEIPD
ncbi:MAG: hypothetical protein HOM68_24385 [Gemmatimonadetes bacterium]|jgi:hypothetical protein|nr:hypothetical protein [Gemmatimonadota bacterium]MBT5059707.1 hypothetical protein [Gemmatimonadota bacterium]MBT5146173.1 hypothetical protein [Gemmatimonadota bacterium]MBT5590816.1 hypothetical protein [Gemmatimonadota bacterium]MBT5961296.1 hypothetical protein [Gemmatimonadota bacterium]